MRNTVEKKIPANLNDESDSEEYDSDVLVISEEDFLSVKPKKIKKKEVKRRRKREKRRRKREKKEKRKKKKEKRKKKKEMKKLARKLLNQPTPTKANYILDGKIVTKREFEMNGKKRRRGNNQEDDDVTQKQKRRKFRE